jgi:hypothetical protein
MRWPTWARRAVDVFRGLHWRRRYIETAAELGAVETSRAMIASQLDRLRRKLSGPAVSVWTYDLQSLGVDYQDTLKWRVRCRSFAVPRALLDDYEQRDKELAAEVGFDKRLLVMRGDDGEIVRRGLLNAAASISEKTMLQRMAEMEESRGRAIRDLVAFRDRIVAPPLADFRDPP